MGGEHRAEPERDQHPDEVPGRPDRDPVRAVALGQVLPRELAHRAEDHGLGDGDRDLTGERPGKRVTAGAHERAERHQRGGAAEGGTEAVVEQRAGRNRQDHIRSGEISDSHPIAVTDTP